MLVGRTRRDQRHEVVEEVLEVGQHRVFLRREVAVEGAMRDVGGFGDVADGDRVEPALADQSSVPRR